MKEPKCELPHIRMTRMEEPGGIRHVRLLDPVNHPAMVRLIEECWAVLTDSGGVQEEAAALGRPALVVRNVTERVEAEANLELVGAQADHIVTAVTALLSDELRYAGMAVSVRRRPRRRANRAIVERFAAGQRRRMAV